MFRGYRYPCQAGLVGTDEVNAQARLGILAPYFPRFCEATGT
jgi:hypothetical protein